MYNPLIIVFQFISTASTV